MDLLTEPDKTGVAQNPQELPLPLYPRAQVKRCNKVDCSNSFLYDDLHSRCGFHASCTSSSYSYDGLRCSVCKIMLKRLQAIPSMEDRLRSSDFRWIEDRVHRVFSAHQKRLPQEPFEWKQQELRISLGFNLPDVRPSRIRTPLKARRGHITEPLQGSRSVPLKRRHDFVLSSTPATRKSRQGRSPYKTISVSPVPGPSSRLTAWEAAQQQGLWDMERVKRKEGFDSFSPLPAPNKRARSDMFPIPGPSPPYRPSWSNRMDLLCTPDNVQHSQSVRRTDDPTRNPVSPRPVDRREPSSLCLATLEELKQIKADIVSLKQGKKERYMPPPSSAVSESSESLLTCGQRSSFDSQEVSSSPISDSSHRQQECFWEDNDPVIKFMIEKGYQKVEPPYQLFSKAGQMRLKVLDHVFEPQEVDLFQKEGVSFYRFLQPELPLPPRPIKHRFDKGAAVTRLHAVVQHLTTGLEALTDENEEIYFRKLNTSPVILADDVFKLETWEERINQSFMLTAKPTINHSFARVEVGQQGFENLKDFLEAPTLPVDSHKRSWLQFGTLTSELVQNDKRARLILADLLNPAMILESWADSWTSITEQLFPSEVSPGFNLQEHFRQSHQKFKFLGSSLMDLLRNMKNPIVHLAASALEARRQCRRKALGSLISQLIYNQLTRSTPFSPELFSPIAIKQTEDKVSTARYVLHQRPRVAAFKNTKAGKGKKKGPVQPKVKPAQQQKPLFQAPASTKKQFFREKGKKQLKPKKEITNLSKQKPQ